MQINLKKKVSWSQFPSFVLSLVSLRKLVGVKSKIWKHVKEKAWIAIYKD